MRFRSPSRNDRSEPPPHPRRGTSRARREKDRARALYLAGLCIAVFDGAHLFYRAEDVRDWITGRVLLAASDKPNTARERPLPLSARENLSIPETTGRTST